MKHFILALLFLASTASAITLVKNKDVDANALIALSKLQTITNNSVVGNVSGGAAVPYTLNGQQLYSLISSYVTGDHGGLTGLGDDDHPQYLIMDGSRAADLTVNTVGSKLRVVGNTTNQDIFSIKGSGSSEFHFGIQSGRMYLDAASGTFVIFDNNLGWTGFGGAAPRYSFDFSRTATSVAPLTEIVQTSGAYNLAVAAIRNLTNTVNTYSALVFSGGSAAQEADVALVATHESTTAGSETGHLDVNIRNAGVNTTRLSISKTGLLTASAYGGGVAKFDSVGGISSVVAPPTNGAVLTSQYGQWISSVVPVPPCVALGSGVAVDWSLGNCFTKTLSGNAVFTFSNRSPGQTVIMRITNPSTYTYTFPNTNTAGNSVLWANSTIPAASTGGKKDIITIFYDGSEMYGVPTANFGGF